MKIILVAVQLAFATLASAQHSHPNKNALDNPLSHKIEVSSGSEKTVTYHLYVSDTTVNYANNKIVRAIAINGQIPAPTLEFTEGDTAIIYVHNMLHHHETSTHWHGLLLPNIEDGVPYLTTPPIKPGGVRKFVFPLKQSGTYWYHSHTMLQEQSGLYGSILIHPKKEAHTVDHDVVLLLSDWTNENPSEVHRTLRRNDPASEWYTIKKGYAQSLDKLISHGSYFQRVKSAWTRMPAMDLSDVYYDAFLVNGKRSIDLSQYKPGDRLRVRVINGSSSTYFYLNYGGGKMLLIAADGLDVSPISIDRILIGTAETYDFLITVPSDGAYELRATPQDISGSTSVFIGSGEKVMARDISKPDVWNMNKMMMDMTVNFPGRMKMNGMNHGATENTDMDGMDMGGMEEKNKAPKKVSQEKQSQSDNQYPAHDMKMDDGEKILDSLQKQDHGGHNMESNDMAKMKLEQDSADHKAYGQHRETKEHNEKNMDHSMHDEMADHQIGQDSMADVVFNYDMLKALEKTTFDPARTKKNYHLTLTGNMYRYVWSINKKVLSEADMINVKKGEVVQFTLENTTMMNHPMHLHGHFFRVLNKNGDYSPLKHTVDVPPMTSVTIEFAADEDKDWFFHCHILYHMMSGMARIVHYEGSKRDTALATAPLKNLFKEDRQWFFYGNFAAKSHMSELQANYFNSRNAFRLEANANYGGQYEAEVSYERYLNDWLRPYIGFRGLQQKYYNVFNGRQTFEQDYELPVLGFRYTLPFFIEADVSVNMKGRVRAELEGEQWLLPRMFFNWRANTDKEYHLDIEYMLAKKLSISAGYDSRYRWGGGLLVRF
ncbi:MULTISPECIES: multicopper oxidase domain-containing protein [Olivibacter]|uniref:Multicopper oxidase domain-containing protein n=1 Tax=Olivibacter oleidegradans TaxID=760123 RepID=A0ABV6HQM4_9SPHI|nr:MULTISPECIES: multicopper oxidase domain-containing protein [Olivibacter]